MEEHNRRTLGVILSGFSAGQHKRFLGIHDAARQRGANVLCFLGGALSDPIAYHSQANIVYQLIDTQKLDGLIVLSTSLTPFVDGQVWRSFIERFSSLPIISTDPADSRIARVFFETSSSVKELIRHLVEDHGRRRIAFIRGPENHTASTDRYNDYVAGLQGCGLLPDNDLVIPVSTWADRTAIKEFLIAKDSAGGIDFDAILATSDQQACLMIEELSALGIRVPTDVSIVGHDDLTEGRISTPPLTTIRIPFYEAGRKMADIMLDHLEGVHGQDEVILSGNVIIRQSCGCIPSEISAAELDLELSSDQESADEYLATNLDVLNDAVQSIQTSSDEIVHRNMEHLWSHFVQSLAGKKTNQFLLELEKVLDRVVTVGDDVNEWQNVLSVFRRHALYGMKNKNNWIGIDNLIGQARIVIGNEAKRSEGQRRWQSIQQSEILQRITAKLVTSDSFEKILAVLTKELPDLGITSCYLALYENPKNPFYAQMMMAYSDVLGIVPDASNYIFPSNQLLPSGFLPEARPYTMVVMPLYYQEEQLGYLIAEMGSRDRNVYESLRVQISSAIRSAMLLLHTIELQKKAEEAQVVAEEANRLKGRFLSTVSHELRTPLSLLVGLSEMMMRELNKRNLDEFTPFRQDLDRLHLAARHLDSLIRDVLDLSLSEAGKLNLVETSLDVKELLESVAELGEHLAHEKGVAWENHISGDIPMIWGDRTRLHQVLLNLINNAVKFTSHGKIILTAKTKGNRVIVSVEDTGLGIPSEDRERIFDDFQQSDRTIGLGYRGLGLGLAICRRLIELHGGKIGVRSSSDTDGGSVFYFTLPVFTGKLPQKIATAKASRGERNSQKILLVTEFLERLGPVSDYLKQRGYEVIEMEIKDNHDWFSDMLEIRPGAIVLDYEPEHSKGWQMIRTLKMAPQTADIPVLFFSLVEEKDQGSMMSLDYFVKPIEIEKLTRALSRHGFLGQDLQGGKTILIVEDEAEILKLNVRAVHEQIPNCKVLQARNGKEALVIMETEIPNLVLLDLMMPELDGFGVLEAMQMNKALRHVPVIVLTAQHLDENLMAKLNRGVTAVLGKGIFTIDETLAHIDQALARSKPLGFETQQIVRSAMAFVHEHFGREITQEDIASAIGVSGRHLTRCFKDELDLSPMTYLRRYRIQQARTMLEIEDSTVSEIAFAVGFSNSSHFGRVFRREVGVSPSIYRDFGDSSSKNTK